MITQDDIRAAQHIIIDSGAAEQFRQALTNRQGGRKPTFDQSIYLLGMYLAAAKHGSTHITTIHEVLTKELPLDQQIAWGIRRPGSPATGEPTWVVSQADLQNVARSLRRALSYLRAYVPNKFLQNREELQRRRRLLQELMDTIVAATLIPRPPDAMDYAIDDTGLWAAERALRNADKIGTDAEEADEESHPSQALESEPDPDEPAPKSPKKRKGRRQTDAAFGVKTSKNGGRKIFYGYSLHALVRAPKKGADDVNAEPPLAERIRITPASQDIVDVSLELIDDVLATGQRIRYLMGDRHYSYKRLDRWMYELLRRRISQVADLREGDHGFREWDGMLFVAGHAHCPQTPERLGTIKKPGSDSGPDAWDDFYTQIQEREAHACERVLPLNTSGETRWRCPARAGTLGCPLVRGTVSASRTKGLPRIHSAPEFPTAICKQDSVGLKVTNDKQAPLLKTHQKHYWGSPEQVALFNRRTFVEGWFGTLKGDKSANKHRGGHLYRGIVHASLDAAVYTAIANTINLRSWHEDTGRVVQGHPLIKRPDEYFGFRYHTQEERDALLGVMPEPEVA